MSKAVEGLAVLGGAAAMVALDSALLASPIFEKIWLGLVLTGVSLEVGALADAITSNRGQNITTRQPAANRQIVYGEQRIGGVMIYNTTTGGSHDQNNNVIMLAGHTIDGVVNLYLDGRQVYWETNSAGQTTCPGGYTFGGAANGTKYYDSGGYSYNFGGLVYCTAKYGYQTAADGADPSLAANDPNWAATAEGVPYGAGCAWVYLKYEYDQVEFSALPEIKFTIRGKNDIWDPRTGSSGYTANWALCVADFMTNEEFGLGCSQAEINIPQLITAANICDEAVPLAAGGTEPRYTFNSAWDTLTSPGAALKSMLTAAGGNVFYSGGQWYIVPASAPSPTAAFSESDLLEDLQWTPYRSIDQLYNQVTGVYTAPNYPYSPTGNLYDASGKDPDGYQQNNFNLAWQRTTYPPYQQDEDHGYATNQFLTEDGNEERIMQLNLPATISVATAQRLAKLALMRNRRQGSGVLTMGLQAMVLMPYDVFTLSYPPYGWVDKLLQVTSFQIVQDMDGDVPRTYVQVGVQEFDPSDYAWSTTEEQGIYDTPSPAILQETAISPVPEFTINTGPGVDTVNTDGVLIPQVQVVWQDPPDVRVTLINVQWSPTGQNKWVAIPPTAVGLGQTYFRGPVAGEVIDVQVQSLTGNGAESTWLQATGFAMSINSVSTMTSLGLAPGVPWNVTNNATIDSVAGTSDYAELRVYGPGGVGTYWTLYTGTGTYYVTPMVSYVPYGSTGFVTITIARYGAATNQYVGAAYSVVSDYYQTIGDNYVTVGSFAAIASDGTGGASGGGGSTGGGANGPRAIDPPVK